MYVSAFAISLYRDQQSFRSPNIKSGKVKTAYQSSYISITDLRFWEVEDDDEVAGLLVIRFNIRIRFLQVQLINRGLSEEVKITFIFSNCQGLQHESALMCFAFMLPSQQLICGCTEYWFQWYFTFFNWCGIGTNVLYLLNQFWPL